MSDWYRTAFGEEYLALYAHRDAAEAEQLVQLLVSHTQLSAGSPVLDAPCGAGRHSRVFAAAGMRVMGMDLSKALLHAAREEQHGRENPQYVRGDLRQLPFGDAQFELVANLFTSLGYFDVEDENTRVVMELARVCRRGGHLVLDFMNATHVKANFRRTSERSSPGGCRVTDQRWLTTGPERVNKRTIAISSTGERKEFLESVRLYSRAELEALMMQAGVQIRQVFGDYSGSAHTSQSPRVVLIGRKQ
jgi:ubiquinone/menaquinone biosynthesis C-methylase UbiE